MSPGTFEHRRLRRMEKGMREVWVKGSRLNGTKTLTL